MSFLVTEDSATHISVDDNFHKEIPLETDHSGLVKFSSHGAPDYDKVQSRIKELVECAPEVVLQRRASSRLSHPAQHTLPIVEARDEVQPPTLPPRPLEISEELQGSTSTRRD